MKNSIFTFAMLISSIAVSQTGEFNTFQLDTKEQINACEITAFVDDINLAPGSIEKINGSVITLRIVKNTDYLILVNNSKYFKIYGSTNDDLSAMPKVELVNESTLIYRIQIGAFSEQIPNSYYVDFKNISTEEKEGTKITRLMTGNYNSQEEANSVKEQIQGQGYEDAFIVAYYKNERIEFTEAVAIESQSKKSENFELTMFIANSNNLNNSNQNNLLGIN